MKFRIKQVYFVVFGVVALGWALTSLPAAAILKPPAAQFLQGITTLCDPYKDNEPVNCGPSARPKAAAFLPARGAQAGQSSYSAVKELLERRNIKIVKYANETIRRTRHDFDYQRFDNKKLKDLRERYGLGRFATEPDFAGIAGLREWVRMRWEHGWTPKRPVRFNNFDALKILEMAKQGHSFVCGESAYTFVQAAVSIGSQARVVTIEDEQRRGHVTAEVWSNQFRKWVLMDPEYNVHYERNGIPLNALELHTAYVKKDWRAVDAVKGKYQLDEPRHRIDRFPDNLLGRYFNIAVRMRNNFFTVYPRWHHKGNLYANTLEWVDKYTAGRPDIVNESGALEDLYWDLNTVCIYFGTDNPGRENIELFFDTVTPNFVNFEINVNGKLAESKSFFFLWRLHEGKNRISVNSVNIFGARGPVSEIELEVL